ncbi:MAG: malonate transporter subunit MadL [Verrucomicrobiaceae bacterium]|nr:malonate transporter subunit MadL [Verrucomicrobiaceae bacterium]
MPIYGTALLSLCLLTGLTVGRLIGAALGVDADIGGVGIAMILLIIGCDSLQRRRLMKAPTENGIVFWGQMYVPIVVAMAASQNVLGALSGGVMAIVAGLAAVALSFVLVAVLAKGGSKEEKGS